MQSASETTPDPAIPRRIWRLGGGAHLALGLAAVAAVTEDRRPAAILTPAAWDHLYSR